MFGAKHSNPIGELYYPAVCNICGGGRPLAAPVVSLLVNYLHYTLYVVFTF